MSSSPEAILRLSASPSPPLESDSELEESTRNSSPFLGIQDLRKLTIQRDPPRHNRSREIILLGHPDEIDKPSAVGDENVILPFAKDVKIEGWKVVGGKTWSDKAKLGSYVVYNIHINLHAGGEMMIMRRYTDFVNLRRSLLDAYPELSGTIPRLPGKAHMSKFATKLLEDRQPRLQRFLRTVMLHPIMGRGGPGSILGSWVMAQDLG